MEDQKPEIRNRKPANPFAGFESPVSGFLFLIVLLIAALGLQHAWAQTNSAVVAGADHVFIRRGPGTEFPPFATLMEGSTVEIQEMHGEWARVLTANGQSGYVKSNFLALPGERRPAATAAAPTRGAPTHAVHPTATPVRSPAAMPRELTEENKNLTAQVGELQQQLAALKAQAEVTPTIGVPTAAPVVPDTDKLHADLTRLTTAVEHLNKRLDIEPPQVNVAPLPNLPADGSARVITSTTILFAAIGLCVGWLLGNTFGRRQERGRRPRVRL